MGFTLDQISFLVLGILMYLLILKCLLNSLSEYLFCLCFVMCLLIAPYLYEYHVSADFAYQGGLQAIVKIDLGLI